MVPLAYVITWEKFQNNKKKLNKSAGTQASFLELFDGNHEKVRGRVRSVVRWVRRMSGK